MANKKWEVIEEAAGELNAEILRGLLESQGIPVSLYRVAGGSAIGLSATPMGRVQILVPEEEAGKAKALIQGYYSEEESRKEV